MNFDYWEFPNQYRQKGAIASPLLRHRLLFRNYSIFVNSLTEKKLKENHEIDPAILKAIPPQGDPLCHLFHFSPELYRSEPGTSYPVMAYGVKGCFQHEPLRLEQSSFGIPSDEFKLERAFMTYLATGQRADRAIGVVTPLLWSHLLAQREENQTIYEISGVRLDSGEIERCYVLSEEPFSQAHLFPHQNYLNACLEIAQELGKAFVFSFLTETLVADQKTPLNIWLRNQVVDYYMQEDVFHEKA